METFTLGGMQHGTPLAGQRDEKYGHHGPYFLDAGLSSAARIAVSWGIVKEATVNASQRNHKRPNVKASKSVNMSHEWMPRNTAKPGVKTLILEALRSAGLMKW